MTDRDEFAKAEAEAFNKAREAWEVLKGPNLIIDCDDHTAGSPRMHDPANEILDAYFREAK